VKIEVLVGVSEMLELDLVVKGLLSVVGTGTKRLQYSRYILAVGVA
jgi:hypothetical protein